MCDDDEAVFQRDALLLLQRFERTRRTPCTSVKSPSNYFPSPLLLGCEVTPEPITAELLQRRGHAVVRLPLYRRYIAGLWTVGRKLEDLERGHRENMQTPCNKNSSRYGNQTHNLLAFQGNDCPVSEFRISSTHQIAREFYRHWQKKNKRKIDRKVRAVLRPPPHVTNVPRRKRTIQKQKKREFVALAYRSPSPLLPWPHDEGHFKGASLWSLVQTVGHGFPVSRAERGGGM